MFYLLFAGKSKDKRTFARDLRKSTDRIQKDGKQSIITKSWQVMKTHENILRYPTKAEYPEKELNRNRHENGMVKRQENSLSTRAHKRHRKMPRESGERLRFAKIADFIRCSLVFRRCEDCVEAIDKLKTVAESKKTCIKAIGRIKNMFQSNQRGGKGLYEYADLKANVLVEVGKTSMVCEVQYLMDWMIEAKKRGHAIYKIMRNKEYVENVQMLSSLYGNPKEELFAIAIREDGEALAKFIVNNPHF